MIELNTLVSPEITLTVGSKTVKLEGSFSTIKALEHAFGESIVRIQPRLYRSPVSFLAKFIAVAGNVSEQEIGDVLLNEYGTASEEILNLQIELMLFLQVALVPKKDREQKLKEVEALREKLKKSMDSIYSTLKTKACKKGA